MAREDIPVLDREMFRKRDMSSRGIEDLPEEVSAALRARREQAMAMMEASKEKFDPKNFQTLTEQDRPGVFRPVAVNMPAQQQTATTAQRMQQMADMGMRPVGMAKGGYLEGYSPYEWSANLAELGIANDPEFRRRSAPALPSYNVEEIQPTISSDSGEGIAAIDLLSDEEKAKAAEIRDAIRAQNEVDPESFDARMANLRAKLRRVRKMSVDPGKATFDLEDTTTTINPETGLPAPSGDLYPNAAENIPNIDRNPETLKEMIKASPTSPSRPSLRPDRGILDLNLGTEAERRERELTEKAIEKRAGMDLPKTIPSGQYVRPEYPRTLTQQELAVKKAQEAGIPVATPGASPGPTPVTPTDTGIKTVPGVRKDAEVKARSNYTGGKEPPKDITKKDDTKKEHPTSLYDIKRDREDAFNMALMMAGLGMMAGKSSNALANIGEGGIMGLKAYADQLAQSRARALEEEKLGLTREHYKLMGALASQRASTADARIKQAQSAAIQKGEISAQAAYDKWLTSMEGQGADDTKKAAKLQQLRKTFTQIHFAEMTSGASSNPDSLDLSGE